MAKPKRDELLTVGELRQHLAGLPADAAICFGCESLTFLDINKRGDKFYQIVFNQIVSDDEDGNVYVNELPPSNSRRDSTRDRPSL